MTGKKIALAAAASLTLSAVAFPVAAHQRMVEHRSVRVAEFAVPSSAPASAQSLSTIVGVAY